MSKKTDTYFVEFKDGQCVTTGALSDYAAQKKAVTVKVNKHGKTRAYWFSKISKTEKTALE